MLGKASSGQVGEVVHQRAAAEAGLGGEALRCSTQIHVCHMLNFHLDASSNCMATKDDRPYSFITPIAGLQTNSRCNSADSRPGRVSNEA